MPTTPSEMPRDALDAAPDAMLIIDAAGIIRFANRQVSALFGYARDEVIGQSIERLMPDRFRTRHVGHREHYAGNVRVRPMGIGLELFGLRRDGTEFPVEISLSPIEDVGRALIAAAIRDVSERKRVEAELIVAREAAEAARAVADQARSIADRARGIADQAREIADRANQGKSRFLAMASHDLRQPVQTLELLDGILRRRVTDQIAIEALSQQRQAIGAMSRLLNALLDISKLESGAIRPEPTDFTVGAIFEEMRMEFASIAANKGLRLEIEICEDAVYSDPSLVEQILRNLVSNAVKYTREGCVSLRCLHEASLVRVEVLDTGVGIAPDHLPYIYDEFYQVGVPTNSSRDGYGLGLSIVQRLVKLLTLKLDVRSELGRGSAFSLVLPASRGRDVTAYRGPAGAPVHGSQPIGEARVLVVEDNASVRRATCLLLELEGYHVTPAASLAEALQHAQKGHGVDLLITDYHLSDGETGTRVIAALREILGISLRAVLTTGDTSSAIQQLPRDPHLRITSKPINSEELLKLLRALLAA
ncbi:MAG: PAS domain S-box protein [Steroidobacteraceae bacterium]|jgi:two-component system, sensor histidine kinase